MNAIQLPTHFESQPDAAGALREVDVPPAGTAAKKIRVCFLIDNLGMGGTELQLLQLINRIDRNTFEPVLCLLDGSAPVSRDLEPDQCEVVRLGIRKLVAGSTAWAMLKFSRFLRRRKIDVLQVHFPDSTYFGVPAAQLAGVRAIVRTQRDLFFWVSNSHRRLGKYLDSFYNRFFIDAGISNCVACQTAMCESVHPAPKSLAVIENGIHLDRFANIPPLASLDPDVTLTIGTVAMLRPEKRLDVLLDAFHQLRSRGFDVKLQIAGEGPERGGLEARIKQHQLESHVRLVGRIQDVPAFLNDVSIAVLCSDTEGLSNALIEYMAAGRAVVATDVGGNRELIEAGVTGLLVPISNSEALGNAMEALVKSPELRNRFATEARQRTLQRFSLQGMVDAHEKFYQKLLSRP